MDRREPRPRLVRPTHMHHAITAALGLLLATFLTGCGDEPNVPPSQPPKSATAHHVAARCPDTDPGVKAARTVATADLDGNGKAETVRLTGAAGRCPFTLFVHLGDRYAAVDTQAHLSGRAQPVQVPGRKGVLLSAREVHPRGGFQVHLYGMDGQQRLGELVADGHPVVPFVALDTESPLSATCARGGVTVSEARPTDPPGVMFAWDVFATSYAVDGTTVTAGHPRKVRTSVPDKVLKKQRPDLFRHAMFAGCGAVPQ